MVVIAKILVVLVALEHLFFLYLEMFAWTKPSTLKTFGTTAEFAEASKTLAANQGLYNGFLAAGLLWTLLQADANFAKQAQLFFLACVIVAGLYGGATVKRTIIFVQALPALIALIAVLVAS